jgi:RNA polymerase-binding protein DksA
MAGRAGQVILRLAADVPAWHAPHERRARMRDELTARQVEELRLAMRARARALREEIRQTMVKSDSEHYLQVADEVRDLEDESFADLIVDVNLAEIDRDLEELRAVEAALQSMQEGRYGTCQHCERPIEFHRLQAAPHATRCFDCQTSFERTHYQRIPHTL